MINKNLNFTQSVGRIKTLVLLSVLLITGTAAAQQQMAVNSAKQINPTTVEVLTSNDVRVTFDFYGDNIFRMFSDQDGGTLRDPQATPPATILVDNPRRAVKSIEVSDLNNTITISTPRIKVEIDKKSSLMKITDLAKGTTVLEQIEPTSLTQGKVSIKFRENPLEYFYGGGVQNGRFSHKGKIIAIENQNSWTDGGVASPTPYYWSTNGYGIVWHTFKKGKYDFGAAERGVVSLYHEESYLDLFVMVGDGAVNLLNDFYQLTGNPVLMPKFGFYQGHLNAYNRDYWAEDEKGILFEDGKRYKESQKDNGGTKESLNGELNNYQFSARAVIDRYNAHDMPFGWLLPNDGYGAGYGQTETLNGNIQNLRSLADYANRKGVEIGLWTQSSLHPKEGISALLQRDIVKEVRDAKVRVLKTDVAWVGAGYSFGLNGVTDVAQIMTYYGDNARPFIISLDGWAGTQRYAGVWSGDQTGGNWEYIRFHIPTYIGSGLSGQPNISSDMDGIFGGKNIPVNTRDFQWKTFTPTELNMDGWGANEKYPHALGEPATSINRWYLKLKSELLPYTYTIAKESVNGKPMIRAMFLEDPNAYTLGKATQYQYMYGPSLLVAPIYQATKSDAVGNDIRNGIYLPQGEWVDYFSGEIYQGGRIINNFNAPLWKTPVFVKRGAIIPMVNPNNNVSQINKNLRIYDIYPYNRSSFTEYDDDGLTELYRSGVGTHTTIESEVVKTQAIITIHPTKGDYKGFEKTKATELIVNMTQKPSKVSAMIGSKKVALSEVSSIQELEKGTNVFFYDKAPNLNKFATAGSEFEKVAVIKTPQLRVKLTQTDITANATKLVVDGYRFEPANTHLVTMGELSAPSGVSFTDENIQAYTLQPTWAPVVGADYYEIELGGMLYSTIKETTLLFELLEAETTYSFKIRAVNKQSVSEWTAFSATTKTNPLEFAIPNIKGESTAESQGRQGVKQLFDFDEGNLWHTKYGTKAVPFDLTMDLQTINQLDKFHYLPRSGRGNGIVLKAKVYHSLDKENWTLADSVVWDNTSDIKIFKFEGTPTARYIKIAVSDAVGGFGSGRELYVFKVPGTESYLPGDINSDGKIDMNDLTSYTNYTGLRLGDADFEGYISIGDLNRNNLIDAYDISVVATQLGGGVDSKRGDKVSGKLQIRTAKANYAKGETIEVIVSGDGLVGVNALSFALPYDAESYEFTAIESRNTKQMENLTNDRLHTNNVKALYPTFVNIGKRDMLEGSEDLFVIKFKARKNLKFDLKPIDGTLVDKDLNYLAF